MNEIVEKYCINWCNNIAKNNVKFYCNVQNCSISFLDSYSYVKFKSR